MPRVKRVVLVGHCGADSYSLVYAVQRVLPRAHVVCVSDQDELRKQGHDVLLLVNRVLDGGFDTDNGIELIRTLCQQPHAPAAMLISNYADAQEEAVQAGALPGFGKSQLDEPVTVQRLRAAAGAAEDAAA